MFIQKFYQGQNIPPHTELGAQMDFQMLAVAIISIPNLQPYQFPKINMFFLSQLTFLNCMYYILLCKHYTEYVLLHSNFGGDILKRQLWYDIKQVVGDV